MDERKPTEQEAESINDQMAASMAERRRAQPERRQAGGAAPRTERPRVRGYCYQPGDHPDSGPLYACAGATVKRRRVRTRARDVVGPSC